MKRLAFLASALALVVTAPAPANIPPPAAPPENLPDDIAGIEGNRVWSSYAYWFRRQARGAAFERFDTSLPAHNGRDRYLERRGPSREFTTTWVSDTRLSRFEQVCVRRRSADGARLDPDCAWQYRTIGLQDLDAIDAAARAAFDPETVAAILRAEAITTGDALNDGVWTAGFAETLLASHAALVTMHVVTERECAGVREGINATREIDLLSLSSLTLEQPPVYEADAPPPPPPPPHPPSGNQWRYTFPINAYLDLEGEITLTAGGDPRLSTIRQAVFAPASMCVRD